MGIASMAQNIGSPVKEYTVNLANDVQWISGNLKSLGEPHNYINQENLDYFLHSRCTYFTLGFHRTPQQLCVSSHHCKKQYTVFLVSRSHRNGYIQETVTYITDNSQSAISSCPR